MTNFANRTFGLLALSVSLLSFSTAANAGEVTNNLHLGQGQGQGATPTVTAPAAQPVAAQPSHPAPAPAQQHPGQGQPAPKPAPQPAPAPQPVPANTQGQGQGQSQSNQLQNQLQLGQQTGVNTETKTTVQTGVDVKANSQGGTGGNAQGGAANQGQSSENNNQSGASSQGNTTKVEANDNSRHKTNYYNPGATLLPSTNFNGGQSSGFSYSGNVCNANIASMSLNEGVQSEKVRSGGINTIFGGFAINSADSTYGMGKELKPVARALPVWMAMQTGTTLNPYLHEGSAAKASQLLYMASIEETEPTAKQVAIAQGLGQISYKNVECGGTQTPPVVVPTPDHGSSTPVPSGQEGIPNNG
jgi:hypothetical protein